MATSSNQLYIKESVNSLDVIRIFNDLMEASTAKDSVYIKAKETLTDLWKNGSYDEKDRASMIAQSLVAMTNSITATAMQLAMQIAESDRDAPYMLTKVREDTKLTQEQADKMARDGDLIETQKDKMIIDGWQTQANIYTKNGISVTAQSIDNPLLTSVAQSNKMGADVVSAEMSKASQYVALAGSFRKDGEYTWSVDANYNVVSPAYGVTSWKALADAQTDVAVRQEKAFDDNMKQHAANSSANMIGLLISSENYTAISECDVDRWRASVDYLNDGAPVPPACPE